MHSLLTRFGANTPGLPAFPAPAPLPNLRDALQRRAAIFGPVDPDPAPIARRGWLARLAALV